MSPNSVTASRPADSRYAALEERIMARDQKGASEVYYGLVRDGRPLPEMLREAVRIHAPYTHVPYHERMDDGYVNFVNNDHCLLSARAALNLSKMLPGAASGLPLAQTIWYIPTGLDIWNQKIAKAPGHYSRGFQMPDGPPPTPVVHWPDQTPLALDGPLKAAAGPMDDAGPSRQRRRRLPRVPRPDAEPGRAPRRAGRALLRRPHRRAGPLLPEPLLHDRPQVLPRPRHRRAGRGDRLGRRARRALCRRARHRRRPALVLALRGGLQRHHRLPRRP